MTYLLLDVLVGRQRVKLSRCYIEQSIYPFTLALAHKFAHINAHVVPVVCGIKQSSGALHTIMATFFMQLLDDTLALIRWRHFFANATFEPGKAHLPCTYEAARLATLFA